MALSYSEQRRIRMNKGLCGTCGKLPRWTNERGKLVSECEKHFKYYRELKRRDAIRARRKKATATTHVIVGNKTNQGAKMTKGGGWKLVATKGRQRNFSGKLLTTESIGDVRIAIFKVRK